MSVPPQEQDADEPRPPEYRRCQTPGSPPDVVTGLEAVGEPEEARRPQKLPAGLTIRVMDEGDVVRVAELLNEEPDALRDDFMGSLVADDYGRLIGILRGWLGHPQGHIEVFQLDMQVSAKSRIRAGVWLLRTFEGLLDAIGARGWTAMTNTVNEPMRRMLTNRGAQVLPGQYDVFVRRWR